MRRFGIVAVICCAGISGACTDELTPRKRAVRSSGQTASPRAASGINPRVLRRFRPVRRPSAIVKPTTAQIDLGRLLWYETRLSADQTISCNSCHDLARYGVDDQPVSTGHRGQKGKRNAPTVYNAANHFSLFWDGRATTVEEQAIMPILNPAEMAMTEEGLLARLSSIPLYRARFTEAFPREKQPVSLANVGRALGAFERGLITESRWDRFLADEPHGLSAAELDGLRLFINIGCLTCHTGPEVGASMFARLGAVEPWSSDDLGRFEITDQAIDKMMFKVPTLKNVAETAPYFHDGSADTLEEAIRRMARHQLGEELDDAEVASIATLLGALTGELPIRYIAQTNLDGATR